MSNPYVSSYKYVLLYDGEEPEYTFFSFQAIIISKLRVYKQVFMYMYTIGFIIFTILLWPIFGADHLLTSPKNTPNSHATQRKTGVNQCTDALQVHLAYMYLGTSILST